MPDERLPLPPEEPKGPDQQELVGAGGAGIGGEEQAPGRPIGPEEREGGRSIGLAPLESKERITAFTKPLSAVDVLIGATDPIGGEVPVLGAPIALGGVTPGSPIGGEVFTLTGPIGPVEERPTGAVGGAGGGLPIQSLSGVFTAGLPIGGPVSQIFRGGAAPAPNTLFIQTLTASGPIGAFFIGSAGAPIGEDVFGRGGLPIGESREAGEPIGGSADSSGG